MLWGLGRKQVRRQLHLLAALASPWQYRGLRTKRLPFAAGNNHVDLMFRNTKFFSKRSDAVVSCGISPQNVSDLRFGEFRGVVCFAALSKNGSLFHGIKSILTVVTDLKVIRVHAFLHVFSRAIMKYAKSIWNRTVIDNPRNNVGASGLILYPGVNLPVTIGRQRSSPKPTGFGLSDLGPKAFDDGGRKSLRCEVIRRDSDHALSVCSVRLARAAELLFCIKSRCGPQAVWC